MKTQSSNTPKVAVVLGSGILTSLGAVSLFKHLEEWKIPVDMTVGCSGGAMAAAVWGAGMNLQSILTGVPELIDRSKTFADLNYRTLGAMAGIPFMYNRSGGVWKAKDLLDMYTEVFQDLRFEDMPRTIHLETTDLDKGKAFTVDKGLVAEAIYASTALFPFLPPIKIQDRWLCDGGWTNPVPMLYPIRKGSDAVIALNVGVSMKRKPKNFLEHIFYFFSQVNSTSELAQSGILQLSEHTQTVSINFEFDHPLDFDGEDNIDDVLAILDAEITPREDEIRKIVRVASEAKG